MTTITSTDGLTLEAAYDLPDDARGSVVVCHPHPRAGGTMNAPLLLHLRDDVVGRGLAVLRFNFRGIGASEGESGDGTPEIADAEGAIADAADRGLPVALLGWSFGAAVAIRTAALHPELRACVAIAPAVTTRTGYTAGVPAPEDMSLEVPLLVITGANDDQVDPGEQRKWAEAAGARFVEVKGANHFFWARYETLSEAAGGFLEESFG
ncbi:MAG: alpha/beta hydrolase [Actinomycetota bacterium]